MMEALFLTVLNMSLTASYVIAAVCVCRLFLKKAPKVVSYALWSVAGFRLMFPFSFESVYSFLPFNAAPIPQNIAMQQFPSIDSGISSVDIAVNSVLPTPVPYESLNPLQIYIWLGSYIWLIGIAVMLAYSFVSVLILERRLKGAQLTEGNIYEADNLKTPFVLGFLKPRIYIPAGLSEEERSYIILHEQTHIRRKDHIIKIIAYFILCVHWFNPFAWLAFLLMGMDMELSCDERVLREMDGDIKKAYSTTLLSFATGRIISGSPLAFGEGGIKARIKNVLNFKKPAKLAVIASVAVAAVFSVGFVANKVRLDLDNIPIGTPQARVHEAFGKSASFTSGFPVDIYYYDTTDGPVEVTIYYDKSSRVENVTKATAFNNPVREAPGANLTLYGLRLLAQKGGDLTIIDIADTVGYGANASSNTDYLIMVYPVEGDFRLIVHSERTGKPDSVILESTRVMGGNGIDIRYDDIEEYISKWAVTVTMRVKDGSLTPTGAVLSITNNSDGEFSFGEDYRLRRFYGDYWADVLVSMPSEERHAVTHTLRPGEPGEISVEWGELHDGFVPGDYLITKQAYIVGADGSQDAFVLSAPFTVSNPTREELQTRARESEIAKSLLSMEKIEDVRVTLFTARGIVMASVVITLNDPLDEAEVEAVTLHISKCVPDLRTENILLADSDGNILSSGNAISGLGFVVYPEPGAPRPIASAEAVREEPGIQVGSGNVIYPAGSGNSTYDFPTIIPFEETISVSIGSENGEEHIAMIDFSLGVRKEGAEVSADYESIIAGNTEFIVNTVTEALKDTAFSEITEPGFQEKFAERMVEEINDMLKMDIVEDFYFNQFFLQ